MCSLTSFESPAEVLQELLAHGDSIVPVGDENAGHRLLIRADQGGLVPPMGGLNYPLLGHVVRLEHALDQELRNELLLRERKPVLGVALLDRDRVLAAH